MATPNIVPRADSEGGLGTASKYWASAYIDLIYLGAGKIGRDADNNIDFSTDNTTSFVVNGNSELKLDASQLYPTTSDGLALGHSSYHWSDLFLATGAVINFGGGNVTLTHSNNRLTLADSDELAFGTGNDLRLQHSGSYSIIGNNTGDLYIQNNANDKDIVLQSDDGSGGTTAYLTLDGSAGHTVANKEIHFLDNVLARFGSSNDFAITHNGTNTTLENSTGNLVFSNYADDGDIIFQSDDGSGGITPYLTLDGSAGYTTVQKRMRFADAIELQLGTSGDLTIKHDGSHNYILGSTGNLHLQSQAADTDVIFETDDGAGGNAVYFYLDGSSATHDGSATTALYTNWPDNSRISLGTSHDFQIHHNATDTLIRNINGDLYIQNEADDKDIIFRADDGSGGNTTYFFLDGSGNLTRFNTRVRTDDNISFEAGNSGDLKLFHDGSNSTISNATGDLIISNKANDKDIAFSCDNGSGGNTAYLTLDGSAGFTTVQKKMRFADNVAVTLGAGDDLSLFHDGTNSSITNSVGNLTINTGHSDKDIIFKGTDGGASITALTLDMSAAGKAIFSGAITTAGHVTITGGSDIFLADNGKTHYGAGNDLEVFHDGSNSYVTAKGTGDLIIEQKTDDKDIIFQSDDGNGGVQTYFRLDGSALVTNFPDNSKLTVGTGNDLQIYHDGSNSYIDDTGTGHLNIRATNLQLLNAAGNKYYASFADGDATKLFHNGTEKLATTTTGILVTSATGTTEGGGIDASDAVSITVGEINGEIITTIFVDIGVGSILSSGTAGDVIGNDGVAAAFITKLTTAINGLVYRGEMICLEVPTTGDPDINLSANASGTIAEDAAGEGEHVLINGGTATLAAKNDITVPSGGIQDDFIYLTHGGTTAGTYDAGKFLIKFYGAKVTGI